VIGDMRSSRRLAGRRTPRRGLVTAKGVVEWPEPPLVSSRATRRLAFVETITAHTVDIRLEDKMAYELDGGERRPRNG